MIFTNVVNRTRLQSQWQYRPHPPDPRANHQRGCEMRRGDSAQPKFFDEEQTARFAPLRRCDRSGSVPC